MGKSLRTSRASMAVSYSRPSFTGIAPGTCCFNYNNVGNKAIFPVPGSTSGETVGVGRGVAALEADLVRALYLERHEEVRVRSDATIRVGVELHDPPLDALRLELGVPGGVQRVRHIDSLPIPADLHHLRAAVEGAGRRVSALVDDAAEVDRAGELGVERVRNVVLAELAGSPARDVEEPVVDGQVDVGDERRHGPEGLQG